MWRMLYPPPFTAADHVQFVKPLVHRITEGTIEVAIEQSLRLVHRGYPPLAPAETFALRLHYS